MTTRTLFMRPQTSLRLVPIVAAVLLLGVGSVCAQPKAPLVEELPEKAPAWLNGYRLRWPVHVVGDLKKQPQQSVVVSVATGGWLKADASDVAVQSADGKVLPCAILSHDPLGETIVQFARHGDDAWYWVYGLNAAPPAATKLDPAIKEGLTLEVREWAGDSLDDWASVHEGLQKSEKIIGNALVAEVVQNCNPARPDQPRRFAASYRGVLDIKKEGAYRFFVNSDDAAFLFIDGFKVFERPGKNQPARKIPTTGDNGLVELKVGKHPFEVHHVVAEGEHAYGLCTLLWLPPDTKPEQPGQPVRFRLVPRAAIAHPLVGRVAALEERSGASVAAFVGGIDDSLNAAGQTLFLARFAAQIAAKDADKLTWDFGDGNAGTGIAPTHVYFKGGPQTVALKSLADLPPFRRRLHVWAAPGATSPRTLGECVRSLSASDWKKANPQRLNDMLAFLLTCEQPERWPLLDALTQRLLEQKDLDPKVREQLIATRMEALAFTGHAKEALQLAEQALPDFAKIPSLKIHIQIAVAGIHQYHLKDAATASKLYKALLDEHKRVEHPNLRLAAIRWGDLFAEGDDLPHAAEMYRLAATLGGEKFNTTALTDASTRGARLRIAEQQLRSGDIRQTRQLLQQIEMDYPEQKLEGPYRFLRAEADRQGGRYEEALRNYEVLMRLQQWAGYRDRALHGIADTYYRMGDWDKALEWYAALNKTFPKYYEEKKLGDMTKLLEARVARIKAAREKEPFFAGFHTGFEPDEAGGFGKMTQFSVARGLGMRGPHVLVIDGTIQETGASDYIQPLRNLKGGSTYWVEFWYRDTLMSGALSNVSNPHVHSWIVAIGDPKATDATEPQISFDRTYGPWRKIGATMKVPLVQDGELRVSFRGVRGVLEIDALSVWPITDRENDSLLGFIEGKETP